MTNIELVTFSLIIDDIVFPDGKTEMGQLGGGGPQTAFGMRLWAKNVGLVAGVGADLPPTALDWLQQMGINTNGLRHSTKYPTARAWQVCEEDGRRTQVWRVPGLAIGAQLERHVDKLPDAYRHAKAFHLGVHPEDPDLEFINALRKNGATVSVEPFRAAQHPLTQTELQALLSAGQIFSPNVQEAVSLVGSAEPRELIQKMVDAGAKIVALRQGENGTTVHRADTGETRHIPAFKITVVDPTGAGNAFCGGFLAGWLKTGDIYTAGLYGAVAASFLLEQVGLPEITTEIQAKARKRYQALLDS